MPRASPMSTSSSFRCIIYSSYTQDKFATVASLWGRFEWNRKSQSMKLHTCATENDDNGDFIKADMKAYESKFYQNSSLLPI